MQQGFTLVEAAVAMVIIAVGIICVVSMQSTSALGNRKSFQMSTASSFAERTIEAMASQDFADISSLVSDLNASGVQYQLAATVTEDVPVANCKQINCTVMWNTSMLRYVYVCTRY